MAEGTVDVRTREGGRRGKMRVNAFAEEVAKEKPPASKAETDFYAKVWEPHAA